MRVPAGVNAALVLVAVDSLEYFDGLVDAGRDRVGVDIHLGLVEVAAAVGVEVCVEHELSDPVSVLAGECPPLALREPLETFFVGVSCGRFEDDVDVFCGYDCGAHCSLSFR